MKEIILMAFASILVLSCTHNQKMKKPYVIEVTSFQYKSNVDADKFWIEDVKVEESYTSQQPGFLSRESGYSKDQNEVVVVVRWETMEAADASMEKFMNTKSVKEFAAMIDGPTMKMARYEVK